jgi:hypothetical protein
MAHPSSHFWPLSTSWSLTMWNCGSPRGVEDVKGDISKTPYKSFVSLWVPQRRLRWGRQVRIA